MDHNRVHDLLEAYTLDELSADERQEVERHLATCAECRALADGLAAVNLLPLALAAASPLRPPDELKDRVLHAVLAPSRPAPAVAGSGDPAPPLDGPSSKAISKSAVPRRSVAPLRAWNWRTIAAAAAVLLLALSLAWGVRLSEALDQERALRERIVAHFSEQQEIVLEVVDADEATRAILRSPDPDSRAYGKLFTRPDLPHVVAMAARLPPPAAGQGYHLWLTTGGRTFLAGVLPVSDQGFGLLTFDADRNGPVYDAARVTLQPVGAEAPGGETVLTWSA